MYESNLAQKIFELRANYMHGLKSANLAGLGWPCPVSSALKNAS